MWKIDVMLVAGNPVAVVKPPRRYKRKYPKAIAVPLNVFDPDMYDLPKHVLTKLSAVKSNYTA